MLQFIPDHTVVYEKEEDAVEALEKGEVDALVLDDAAWPSPSELEPESRLERLVYLGDDRCIRKKYVKGRKIVG